MNAILRSLRRAPIFTAAVIGTLALGLGATASIFSVLDAVILRPLPYRNPDRLVALSHTLLGIGIPTAGQSLGTYFTYQRDSRTLTDVAVYQRASLNLSDANGSAEPERVFAGLISASLLPTLGIAPAQGRNFTKEEDLPTGAPVVILSDALWHRRYGADPHILGRAIQINGARFTVIGVMPSDFHFPGQDTQLWQPLKLNPAAPDAGGFSMAGVGRLAPGARVADAQRELNALIDQVSTAYPDLYPGMPTASTFAQAKLHAVVRTMKEQAVGGFARVLWIIVATVALVLVVTCANVTNLMLVRAQGRGRELAVRSALGASRGSLLARFLNEGLILSLAGGMLGLGIAAIAVRLLVHSGAASLPRISETHVGFATFAFTFAVAVLVAAMCSGFPVARFRGISVAALLRDGGRMGTAGPGQHRVQHVLVIVQMALAVLLLAGSGLLVRTVLHLRAVRPGFDPSHTLAFTVTVPAGDLPHARDVSLFYQSLTNRIGALAGVENVGLTQKVPLLGGVGLTPYLVEEFPVEGTTLPPVFAAPLASAGYFATMRIPLLAGRVFGAPSDPATAREAIVSRAFAERYWHDPTGRAAIGKRIRQTPQQPWETIVGVVESVRDSSLTADGIGEVYQPVTIPSPTQADSTVNLSRFMTVVVRSSGDPTALVAPVRRAIRSLSASIPIYDVQSMTEVLARSMAQTTFVLAALGAAALITLVLGAVGLYGVIAYSVSLRTREIGVRMALGAAPGVIHTMVLREGLVLAVIGVGIGLVAFLGIGRVLRKLLFEVGPADPVTFLGTTVLLLAISLMATWLPAHRAARADPLEALRME